MTSMKRNTLIAGLLGMTLLSGCATLSTPSQPGASVMQTELAGKNFDLAVQASAPGSTTAWRKADIEKYVITLTDTNGKVVTTVVLDQTGLEPGETPKSKVKFENLHVGQTYTATVAAKKGDLLLNSLQTDNTVTFEFGNQDVEDLIERFVTIKLDGARFSGTLIVPLSELNFGSASRKVVVTLHDMSEATPKNVYEREFPLPGTGSYNNYILQNVWYGTRYRVTLASYNKGNQNHNTLTSTTFLPFPDTSTASFPIPKDYFKVLQ